VLQRLPSEIDTKALKCTLDYNRNSVRSSIGFFTVFRYRFDFHKFWKHEFCFVLPLF
jgi:hypothetical protein